MKSSSAMTNRPAAQRLISPRSAAWAPALIPPMMAVVLTPPIAETKASRPREPCISLRTSWKKDIGLRGPLNSSRAANHQSRHARKHSATPCTAFRPHAARRPGDQQDHQRQDWGDYERQQKRPGEPHPALAAAQPNQNAEYQVRDQKRER